MKHTSLFYRSFYKAIKEKIWRTLGIKLAGKRNIFLVNLLKEQNDELKISKSVRNSDHYLLDVGCGDGSLTKKISEIYLLKTIGVDVDKMFIPGSNIAFLKASGCSLPLKPKCSALVVAFSMIEHVREVRRQGFYKEVRKVLMDNGTLVMQLPNRYFPIEQHSFLPFVGYLPSRLHGAFFHDYLSTPSKDSTVNELVKAGFRISRVVGYGVPFSNFLQRTALSKVLPFGFLIIAKKMRWSENCASTQNGC